jgi:hypothetical protein
MPRTANGRCGPPPAKSFGRDALGASCVTTTCCPPPRPVWRGPKRVRRSSAVLPSRPSSQARTASSRSRCAPSHRHAPFRAPAAATACCNASRWPTTAAKWTWSSGTTRRVRPGTACSGRGPSCGSGVHRSSPATSPALSLASARPSSKSCPPRPAPPWSGRCSAWARCGPSAPARNSASMQRSGSKPPADPWTPPAGTARSRPCGACRRERPCASRAPTQSPPAWPMDRARRGPGPPWRNR